MKTRILLAAVVSVALAAGTGLAQDGLKSGPQVGDKVPGPFHPTNVTGKFAGEKHCLFCENGTAPVAMIFARQVSPGLTQLIRQIDAATAKNRKARMGSFVVFLSDDEKLPDQLKELANKENIKSTVLSIDNPAGPQKYHVSKQADVTVVLYDDHTVRANHAYRSGELTPQAVQQIVAELPKILQPPQ
jgi:hypothetical protein